jgi:hypothetical protein
VTEDDQTASRRILASLSRIRSIAIPDLAGQRHPGNPECPRIFRAVRNLRNPENYESARLELSIAALLCEESFDVRFIPDSATENRRTWLRNATGEEVYFEVNILRELSVLSTLQPPFDCDESRDLLSILRSLNKANCFRA